MAGERLLQRFGAGAGDLVVAARRALLGPRALRRLPPRAYEPGPFEAPQDGVHGAALEPRRVEDVEAVAQPVGERDEDEGGGTGEADGVGHGPRALESAQSLPM